MQAKTFSEKTDISRGTAEFKHFVQCIYGHTSNSNVKEVSGSQVLKKDTVCRRSLKVEGDVGAAFSSEGGKVEIGGRATEGGCVPEVPFKK